MEKTVYQIKIRIYISEMIDFYRGNPEYGTIAKPYPADSFYELISPFAQFYGPLKNILIFQDNSTYQWVLESTDETSIVLSDSNDGVAMEMEMITNKPSDTKWEKVFKNAPKMQANGKIKIKSKGSKKNIIEMETSSDIAESDCIKYSILFEFQDKNGVKKYAYIDPQVNTSPPPPPTVTGV